VGHWPSCDDSKPCPGMTGRNTLTPCPCPILACTHCRSHIGSTFGPYVRYYDDTKVIIQDYSACCSVSDGLAFMMLMIFGVSLRRSPALVMSIFVP
jgi:hypothetical protein